MQKLTAGKEGFITLDSVHSQAPEAVLMSGDVLQVNRLFDPFYAYVAFHLQGRPARGFVPLGILQQEINTVLVRYGASRDTSREGSVSLDKGLAKIDNTLVSMPNITKWRENDRCYVNDFYP